MSFHGRFRFEPAALDSLGLSLLLFDDQLAPMFLSSRAAQQFGVRDRTDLAPFESIFQPLRNLARASRDARSSQLPESKQRIEEAFLQTTDGRKQTVLALAREVEIVLDEKPILGTVVVFYDLTVLQPFVMALEQARKIRPTLILASALVGRALSEVNAEELLQISQSQANESPGALDSRLQLRSQSTDLLTSLTLGIEIVDRLMPQTFRIALDVTTSALLALSRPAFLRVLCHTLLEAGDFAGPYGKARLGAFIKRPDASEGPKKPPAALQILVLAQRFEPPAVDAHPLDLYIFRKCIPSNYRITRSRQEKDAANSLSAEEQIFFEKQIGKEALQRLPASVSVPEELFSENLRIASHIAFAERSTIGAKLLTPSHLALSLELPLVGGGSGEQRAVQGA
ncbi:MAG: hypothetical protein U0136_03480 [Bdellovibrionota bacterium]